MTAMNRSLLVALVLCLVLCGAMAMSGCGWCGTSKGVSGAPPCETTSVCPQSGNSICPSSGKAVSADQPCPHMSSSNSRTYNNNNANR